MPDDFDPEKLDEAAAAMARTFCGEDWPILDDDRKGLWRSLATDAAKAAMLAPGPEKTAAIARLQARVRRET